jgi:NADH-quinone oxidoreductase subunit G
MQEVGAWDGERVRFDHAGFEARKLAPRPADGSELAPRPADGADNSLTLATWKPLLDDGRMLDGDDYLKATARAPVALVSAGTLDALGLAAGEPVEVSGDRGTTTLPVAVTDLPDGVVWTPTRSGWSAPAGSVVRLAPKGAQA